MPDKEKLEQLVKEAVMAGFKECMLTCPYNLSESGVTPDQHREHHHKIAAGLKDFCRIRLAVTLILISSTVGGALTALWMGIKHFMGVPHYGP